MNFLDRLIIEIMKKWNINVCKALCLLSRQHKLWVTFRHLNRQHKDIRVTVKKEQNNCLPFINVLIRRHNERSHTVYRKNTHSNRYIYATSHHQPQEKRSAIKTLIHLGHNWDANHGVDFDDVIDKYHPKTIRKFLEIMKNSYNLNQRLSLK